ncbi:MAG: hypothetical protein V4570_02110 [Pseudomonadota bacterium]
MDESELIADSVMLGERNYAAALDLVIMQAESELLIFDQSFEKGDYASLKRFDLIQSFLGKNAYSELTIILQNAHFFSANCARLFDLLSIYGHKMRVYETNDMAKVAKDCFVIADKKHYCRRFHIDQARFKFALNDAEAAANLLLRYDELLAETAEAISVTKLGL